MNQLLLFKAPSKEPPRIKIVPDRELGPICVTCFREFERRHEKQMRCDPCREKEAVLDESRDYRLGYHTGAADAIAGLCALHGCLDLATLRDIAMLVDPTNQPPHLAETAKRIHSLVASARKDIASCPN